jgi:integrase
MRDDDLWFPNAKGDAVGSGKRSFKKAGIGWGSFHHFHHFGACHMINNGEGISVVSRWLGHKDISTTMIYARVNRDKLKLASKVFDTNLHKSAC